MDIGVWEAGVKRTPVAPAVSAFVYPATEFACIDGARRYRINRNGVDTWVGRHASAGGIPGAPAVDAFVQTGAIHSHIHRGRCLRVNRKGVDLRVAQRGAHGRSPSRATIDALVHSTVKIPRI